MPDGRDGSPSRPKKARDDRGEKTRFEIDPDSAGDKRDSVEDRTEIYPVADLAAGVGAGDQPLSGGLWMITTRTGSWTFPGLIGLSI